MDKSGYLSELVGKLTSIPLKTLG